MEQVFKGSLLGDWTPDEIILDDDGVGLKIRSLIKAHEDYVFYKDIASVEVDSRLFLATIRIKPRARPELVIDNFSKNDAVNIRKIILERVKQKQRRR